MPPEASKDSACVVRRFPGLGVAGVAVGESVVEVAWGVACPFDPNGPNGAFLTQAAPSGGLPNTTAYGRGSLFQTSQPLVRHGPVRSRQPPLTARHPADTCRRSDVGKLLPNALYLHRSALESLDPLLRVYEGCARAFSFQVFSVQ